MVRISDLASRDPALLEEFSSPAIVDPLESLLGPNIDFIRNRHNHATVAVEPTYRSRFHRDILQWSRNILSVIVYRHVGNAIHQGPNPPRSGGEEQAGS